MLNEFKIAVTGASGWVGKNLIEALFQNMRTKNFKNNVFLYGSKNKSININKKINNLKINNLLQFSTDAKNNRFDMIFHCAFIVRDHINKIGTSKYIELNSGITNLVLNGIKESKNSKLVLFSSGAASPYKKLISKEILEKDPYGALKRQEEIIFNDYIDTQVMRIYALSGKYIRTPYRFAISNFILQAKHDAKIYFKSQRKILRGYINAKDLANLSILISRNNHTFKKYKILDAVSDEIDLLILAKLISEKFNNVPVFDDINKDLSVESYSASSHKLKLISKELDYKLMNIEEQIIDTINGIKN